MIEEIQANADPLKQLLFCRSVSTRMLADIDSLSAGGAVSAVAELSMRIHRDVGSMAQRFHAELRRR